MQNILEIDLNLTKIIHSLRNLLTIKVDKYVDKKLERFIQRQIELYQALPNTRNQATQGNYQYYFTGKPCINGHFRMRRTSDAHCLSCDQFLRRKGGLHESR